MGALVVRKKKSIGRVTSLVMGISLALLMGAAVAFLVFALPQHALERLTTMSRLSKLMVEAEPPISTNDRALLAALAGIATAGVGWVLVDWLLFGKAMLSMIFRPRHDDDYEEYDAGHGPAPIDFGPLTGARPMAPPALLQIDARRPLSAVTDIGEPTASSSPAGTLSPAIDELLPPLDQLLPGIPSAPRASTQPPAPTLNLDMSALAPETQPQPVAPFAEAPVMPQPFARAPSHVQEPEAPIAIAPPQLFASPLTQNPFAAPSLAPPMAPPQVEQPADVLQPPIMAPPPEPVMAPPPPPPPPAPAPIVEEAPRFHAPVPVSLDQAPLSDLLARLERGMATRRAPAAPPAPPAPMMAPTPAPEFVPPLQPPPPIQAAPVERQSIPSWVVPILSPPVLPQAAPISAATPTPPIFVQPVMPVPTPPAAPVYEAPAVGGPVPLASTPVAPIPLQVDIGRPVTPPKPANVLDGDAMLDEPLHMALEKLRDLVRKHG